MPDLDLQLADWAAIAQIVLGVTALAALVVAIVQIAQARSNSRQILTYNYTQRFSSPELLPFHQITGELLAKTEASEEERYREFTARSREDQLAALLIPNLIEELAGMYNHGLVDKKIAKEFFGEIAREVWINGAWLIERWRATDPAYYKQWQEMLEAMGLLENPAQRAATPPRRSAARSAAGSN